MYWILHKKWCIVVPEPFSVTTPEQLTQLAKITEELTRTMEKTRIAEYVEYLEHPGRLLLTGREGHLDVFWRV